MSCLERKVKKLSAECKQVLIKKEEEAADSFQVEASPKSTVHNVSTLLSLQDTRKLFS